jgi:hypothetical protein
MNTLKSFENIIAWQKARDLVKELDGKKTGYFGRDIGLRDQIRRHGISVMAHLAPGSAAEHQSHLYVTLGLSYIQEDIFKTLYEKCAERSKMILEFQNYLPKSNRTV